MGSLAVYFSCDLDDVLDASARAWSADARSRGMSTETEYLCHLLSCGVDRLLHGRVHARDDDEDDDDDEDFVRRLHPSLRFEGSVEHSRLMRRWLEVLGVPVAVFEPVFGRSLRRTDLVAGIPGEQLERMHVPPLGFWNRDVVDILPVIDDVADRYLACDRETFEAFPLPRFLDQRSFDELMLRNLSVLRRLLEGHRHAVGRVMIVSEML